MGKFLTAPTDFRIRWLGGKILELDRDLVYETDTGLQLEVPASFCCDLASVPKLLTWLVPDWRSTARAGVLHDALYRYDFLPSLSRKAADDVFYGALLAEGNSRWQALKMWSAVRMFGRWSYRVLSITFSPPRSSR